jgi:hypothetical protein
MPSTPPPARCCGPCPQATTAPPAATTTGRARSSSATPPTSASPAWATARLSRASCCAWISRPMPWSRASTSSHRAGRRRHLDDARRSTPGTNTVYVTTGTLNQVSQTMSESMVALDATTLAIKSLLADPAQCRQRRTPTGATRRSSSPTRNGRALVAAINKNGFLYAFDRSNLATGPVWSEQVAIGGICPTCGDASVASMAFAQGCSMSAGATPRSGASDTPEPSGPSTRLNGAVVWAHGLARPGHPGARLRQRHGLRRIRTAA